VRRAACTAIRAVYTRLTGRCQAICHAASYAICHAASYAICHAASYAPNDDPT